MTESEPDAAVREFADGVLGVEEGGTYEQTFGDWVAVPSRFDRESAVARWRFEGRLAVTVHSAGD